MKCRSRQRGAAVVEFAVLISLLLIFLVGIVEFGFLWLQSNYIAGAAREGARTAAKIRGSNVDAREAAAEQAAEAYLKSHFLFVKRGSCLTTDANYPLNCAYAVNDADFVTIVYARPEQSLTTVVGSETVVTQLAEVTVTVKTAKIWEPLLWPLLNSVTGSSYGKDFLKELTQTAAYAIE